MGRRKSRNKPIVTRRKLDIKKMNEIPTSFDCLSCNEEGSVECQMFVPLDLAEYCLIDWLQKQKS